MPGFEMFSDLERKEVQDVLDSGVLMRYGFDGMRKGHWKAKELEKALEERFQVNHAQLTSSGTAALTVAMAGLGVGHGDEVILPTFTFVASFEAVISLGATPVLVDVDDTLTLDPKAVEAAITPRTKVIMPVHMCGSMADLDALKAICDKHNLFLLEDACQAIGGSYKGKPLGSIGHVGCFSFDYVKTITCGEGGALITNDEELYKKADHFSDHGHDHIGADRGADLHPFIGYNFRISELHAAVGVAQIKRLDDFVGLQQRNHQIIEDAISSIDGITMRRVPDGGVHSGAFVSFFTPSLEMTRAVVESFKEAGIDAFWHYYDNNWHYIREWDHLKNATTLYPVTPTLKDAMTKLGNQTFEQSDHFIGRNISCLVKLSWTEEEVKARALAMKAAISKVFQTVDL